jgi:Tfp pilus assembly protein PilF
VIEKKPRLPNAYVVRANAYAEKREKEAARADLLKALELSPRDWFYRKHVEEMLAELDK